MHRRIFYMLLSQLCFCADVRDPRTDWGRHFALCHTDFYMFLFYAKRREGAGDGLRVWYVRQDEEASLDLCRVDPLDRKSSTASGLEIS